MGRWRGGTFVILTKRAWKRAWLRRLMILSTRRPLGTECHAEDSESQARR